MNFESQEAVDLAVKALDLPEGEYRIEFVAETDFRFLRDPDEIIDGVDWDLIPDEHELAMAIEDGTHNVSMPTGYRLIGLRKQGRPMTKRIYGIVDFSALEADA